MKLLIVDDHSSVRKMLKSMYGYLFNEIFEAKDGVEAVKLYEKHKPDWVFMDIKMKRMDGIAATKKIIQFDSDAKVLVVTLFSDEDIKNEAERAGAYGLVLKDDLTKISDIINR